MLSLVNYKHRNIFFEGNSFQHSSSVFTPGGQYIPIQVYNSVRTGRKLTASFLAKSGRTQSLINSSMPTAIIPFLRKGDIIFLWEGTNDISVNSLSGETAYANLVTYCNAVRNQGAKLVLGTVPARDGTSDDADLMDRIGVYNGLIRTNQSSICDVLVDIGADPLFDTVADTLNATYYQGDQVHFKQAGQDVQVSLIVPGIEAVI